MKSSSKALRGTWVALLAALAAVALSGCNKGEPPAAAAPAAASTAPAEPSSSVASAQDAQTSPQTPAVPRGDSIAGRWVLYEINRPDEVYYYLRITPHEEPGRYYVSAVYKGGQYLWRQYDVEATFEEGDAGPVVIFYEPGKNGKTALLYIPEYDVVEYERSDISTWVRMDETQFEREYARHAERAMRW